MAITFTRTCHDLRLSAVSVFYVIAFMCTPDLRTVSQRELKLRCGFLNDSTITGLAAFGCHPVNSNRWVSFVVCKSLFNDLQGLPVESRKYLFCQM